MIAAAQMNHQGMYAPAARKSLNWIATSSLSSTATQNTGSEKNRKVKKVIV